MRSRILLTVALFSLTAAAAASCEEWCKHACEELNGNIEQECGGCDTSDPAFTCHPEAANFANRGAAPRGAVPQMYEHHEDRANTAAFDYHPPHVHESGACEFEMIIDHREVNRTWLLGYNKPVLVRGATEDWSARTKWEYDSMLRVYGDSAYHVEHSGNVPLGQLLQRTGKYNMGHMVWPADDCYKELFRPYSPFLSTTAADYEVPSYLKPMRTFQMGIGTGEGIGVPPENHPSAWFAAVVGRKRWILTPPGPQPPPAMLNYPGCLVQKKATASLTCDQLAGDLLWVPDWWWHETCGLDNFSVGIGGITYENADKDTRTRPCAVSEGEYRSQDIKYCQEHGCPGLENATIKKPTSQRA